MAGFNMMPASGFNMMPASGFNLMPRGRPASGFNFHLGSGFRGVGGFLGPNRSSRVGIPPSWRRGRGIKGIEWYNPINASPIGMGHYAPGITDKIGRKGLPFYVNMQETQDSAPVINNNLGASRVNPTWDKPYGSGLFDQKLPPIFDNYRNLMGPNGHFGPPPIIDPPKFNNFMADYGRGAYGGNRPPPIIGSWDGMYGINSFGTDDSFRTPPFFGNWANGAGVGGYMYQGINPTNGTTQTPYDPIYGFPMPQTRNVDFWTGKRMGSGSVLGGAAEEMNCGLTNPDVVCSMIGAGMGDLLYQGSGFFDHFKTFFNTLFSKNKDPVSVGHTLSQGPFQEIAPSRWRNDAISSNFERGFDNLKWSTNGFNDPFFKKPLRGPGRGMNWGGPMAVYDVLGAGLNTTYDFVNNYTGGGVSGKIMPQVCMMPDKKFCTHMTNYLTKKIDGSGAPPSPLQIDRWVGEGATRFFGGKVEPDRSGGFLDLLWDLTKKISPAGLIFNAITGHEFGSGVGGGNVGGFLDILWDLTKKISPAGLLFKAISGHEFGSGVGGFSLGGIFSELGPLILGDLQKEFGRVGKGVDGSLGALFTAIGCGAHSGHTILSELGDNAGGMAALLPCMALMGNGVNGRICKMGMMGFGPFMKLEVNRAAAGGKIGTEADYKSLLDRVANPSTPTSWMERIGKFLTKENIQKVLSYLPTFLEGVSKTSKEFTKGKDADMKKLWGELASLMGKPVTRDTSDPTNMPIDATQEELKARDWGEAAPPRTGRGLKRAATSIGGMSLPKICRTAVGKGVKKLYEIKTKEGGAVGDEVAAALNNGSIPEQFKKILAPLFAEPNQLMKSLLRPDTKAENIAIPHVQPKRAPPLQPNAAIDIIPLKSQFANNTTQAYNFNPVLIGTHPK